MRPGCAIWLTGSSAWCSVFACGCAVSDRTSPKRSFSEDLSKSGSMGFDASTQAVDPDRCRQSVPYGTAETDPTGVTGRSERLPPCSRRPGETRNRRRGSTGPGGSSRRIPDLLCPVLSERAESGRGCASDGLSTGHNQDMASPDPPRTGDAAPAQGLSFRRTG